MSAALALLLALGSAPAAQAHEAHQDECVGVTQRYADEDLQRSFMLNYFSLATTYSPLHGPVPQEPGHGAIGLELAGVPPLSCERRLVFASSKAEDTNKTPVIPRPRLSFTLPSEGHLVGYGSAAYIPPVTIFGTRNVIVSLDAGLSWRFDGGWQSGLRFHATLMKTIGDIAGAFDPADPAYQDLYLGSSFGGDLLLGKAWERWTPYAAVGVTDVSTFFYIGDDGVVQNNAAPFAGPTASLGVQARPWRRLELAGELYTAPGALYTGRLLVGLGF